MIIRHGSEDSLDVDVYVVIENPIDSIQECKELCESYIGFNANLITITDGQVSWCYKGTIDECNNSILATYNLHAENTAPCPITKRMERDVELKVQRTVRGLLSYLSRTHLREEVKAALKSSDMNFKREVLEKVTIWEIPNFGKKGENKDVYKFFAFQLVQTCALMDVGVEIFTKAHASDFYPTATPYLYRKIEKPEDAHLLQSYFDFFTILLEERYGQSIQEESGCS